MRGPELDRPRDRNAFDPVAEGARYRLPPELSLAIWERVCADATDAAGRRDLAQAQQRFHDIAARIAARGGRLRPDVGKLTRAGVESDGLHRAYADELAIPTPGRQTLVAAEEHRGSAPHAAIRPPAVRPWSPPRHIAGRRPTRRRRSPPTTPPPRPARTSSPAPPRSRARGSLASGWKGPHKLDKEKSIALRFNPRQFDCDAFVEIPNKMWKQEFVDTGVVPPDKSWAKLEQVQDWPRAAKLLELQAKIIAQLKHIKGYEIEDGEPYFSLTLQPESESISKMLEGNVYPTDALAGAGAGAMEAQLPDDWTRDTRQPGKRMPEVNEEI